MPPSGHSSSSHSSSSSGSSSYSSGSGTSSGPSSHSSSSYSSTSSTPFSSSFSGHSPGRNRPGSRPAYFSRPPEKMKFPSPPPDTYHYSNRQFFGNRHQYRFYPTAFVINGTSYDAGYYDEDGTYYRNLEMEDENGNTVKYLTCEYCGCQAEYKPEDGAIPNCTHCGAPLKVENIYRDSAYKAGSFSGSDGGSMPAIFSNILRWMLIIIAACFVFNIIFAFFFMSDGFDDILDGIFGSSSSYTQSVDAQSVNTQSVNRYAGGTLYLKKSGDAYTVSDSSSYDKKLDWDSSADSHYDRDTGCWAWYNVNVSPALWQYWYEGISSEYGDFGWMEYEGGKWYIETDRDSWKQYTGDTSVLWHIE